MKIKIQNLTKKQHALQRIIGIAEDYLEKIKEEYGRSTSQYANLKYDLSIVHELRRDLDEIKKKEGDRLTHDEDPLQLG